MTDILQTLGNISSNASALPIPSSALKRSNSISNIQQPPHTAGHARSVSGSRMSLAPGRPNQPMFQRSSSGSGLADLGHPSTVQRPSTNTMFGSNSGRKSYAPGINATPASSLQLQNSTQRRSSIYTARQSASMGQIGHQSFFTQAPIPAGVPRDPRPLKDRAYQAQIAQDLLDYLTQNNFEMDMKHSLTQNSMRSPTQKDFNNMFQWLYQRIDPSYRFHKSIDAEVPPILKQLRYPFEKSITKSQIAAVGGQNWSTFLGVLHWMMQLARMMEQYNRGNYDEACAEAGFDVSGDRIIFDFLADAYHEWLAMEDDQEDKAEELMRPHVEAMAAKFEQTNAKYLDQVKALESEHKELQDQIDTLGKSAPRMAKLDEQIKVLEEDKVKFEEYNIGMQGKVEKYNGRAKLLSDEIQKIELELQEIEREKEVLQTAVDAQGMTIADIDRMNNERERLQRGVESTAQRLEETQKLIEEKELDAGQKLDGLERSVHEYNSLGYQISIIPNTASNAKGNDYELSLLINPNPDFRSSRSNNNEKQPERLLADASNGYQPHHLLNLDVKGAVKSGIIGLRKEIGERKNGVAETDMNNKDLLDKIREAMEDKQQEVEALGHRVRLAEDEFEKTREVCYGSFHLANLRLTCIEYKFSENGQRGPNREAGKGTRAHANHHIGKCAANGAT